MNDRPVSRILLTGDTVGGVWTFVVELAAALAREGTAVCLVTFGREATDAQREQVSALCNVEFFDSGFKVEWMDDPWPDVEKSGRWLMQIYRRFKPDIVHLNTLGHGGLDWDVPTLLTVHSCVASWWAAVKGSALPEQWSRYRCEVERSLIGVTVVTAPSHSLLQDVHEAYSVDLTDVRVIHNGRKTSQFHVGSKEHFILSAGRLWDEAKNITALLHAAPSLPWPVYLAGALNGGGKQDVDLPKNVRWLGELAAQELAEWYARAAIYVLPAKYEPFGLSILEAALSGCALVLGDIPSLREIWDGAAVFVRPDDPMQLESEIQRIIDGSERRARLGSMALVRAKELTAERMTSQYLRLYSNVRHLHQQTRQACVS
jgi:glycogen synthase